MPKTEIDIDQLTALKIFNDLSPIIEKYFEHQLEMVDVFAKLVGGFGAEAMKKHGIALPMMVAGILDRVTEGLKVCGHDISFGGVACENPSSDEEGKH